MNDRAQLGGEGELLMIALFSIIAVGWIAIFQMPASAFDDVRTNFEPACGLFLCGTHILIFEPFVITLIVALAIGLVQYGRSRLRASGETK